MNTTIAGNHALQGGAIETTAWVITLKGTILASNSGGNCGSDSGGRLEGYKLSDDTSCAAALSAAGDHNPIDPGLDAGGLQNHGGPTPTIALSANSPAIDAIPTAQCTLLTGTAIGVDQRGIARHKVQLATSALTSASCRRRSPSLFPLLQLDSRVTSKLDRRRLPEA